MIAVENNPGSPDDPPAFTPGRTEQLRASMRGWISRRQPDTPERVLRDYLRAEMRRADPVLVARDHRPRRSF